MFSQEDIALLKKLKKRTLLDLALTLPTSYKDTTLSKSIEDGKNFVGKVEVLFASTRNGKLHLDIKLEDFNQRASVIFFKTTPYHKKLFSVGSKHTISGKVSYFRGALQITQPQSIKSFGKIVPQYKTVLKESEIATLIKRYITQESLFMTGLYQDEIDTILKLHYPKSISDIKKYNELKPEIIDSLKSIEAYNHLAKYSKKRVFNKPIKSLNGDIDKFLTALPFKLTQDQLDAIANIKEDLASTKKAAKRLIIGDVGSGKTMVILAVALIASKSKSILMAPTSLLANQLLEEAKKYLSDFLSIAFVTQKVTEGDYTKADFIIGTHALLYKDDLPKVALVMVDEQHRFGTNQRAKLDALTREQDASAHFLQFSATPIPRSQALIESELIDITTIKMLPFKKSIDTKVISKEHFSSLLEHIKEQISNNHQTIIVYPLVEPSDEINYTSLSEAIDFWQNRFDGVYSTHGKDKDKDSVLLEFRENGNILLSTTVIEVGISLPKLTTIVIVAAERFGLATLHQLRGRVGRYGIDSFCYLYTNLKETPQRLKEFSKTLDGFKIAKLDLKYRDSGDLLDGTIQSGRAFKYLDLSEDEEIIAQAKQRVKKLALK